MATVRTQAELVNAIAASDPSILVAEDIGITSSITIGYAVKITGEQGVSLFWRNPTTSAGNMLIVNAAGELELESIILDAEARDGTLVSVRGGKFTINDGVIIRNIYSRSSNNGVAVGATGSGVGGTFIMNGGLITGIDSSDAVFSSGGAVFMYNDAMISDNFSAGISMMTVSDLRPSLTMAGHSGIINNESRQGSSGGIMLGADVVMGVDEGDAPVVKGNRSPAHPVGGWFLSSGSTLVMRYGAEISDNYSAQYGGGLAVNQTTVSMYDDAVIRNNKADEFAAGVITSNSTITMDGRARITGNESGGRCGGIELQNQSVLRMQSNSAVYGNIGTNAAGIYLNSATAYIGSEAQVYSNTATGLGGGVFISATSTLDLHGQALIRDNTAVMGKGVYKNGRLQLSESPRILDGLFFDDLDAGIVASTHTETTTEMQMQSSTGESVSVRLDFTARNDAMQSTALSTAESPLYCDNVPVIIDALTSSARIQLESSGYVSPPNVALVISDKGDSYPQLGEDDRAAWVIPPEFGAGHAVVLSPELHQVIIDLADYKITYRGLYGIENPNPESYRITDLPIELIAPEARNGWDFVCWKDADGNRVDEITMDMAGDISLSAVWEPRMLVFDGNAKCVCSLPSPVRAWKDKVVVPQMIPKRHCYRFICWNIPESGSGKVYFPGDTIEVAHSMTLYAQWQRSDCCCDKY